MSGVKGRSGRKSDQEIKRIRSLLDNAVTDDDWHAAFKELSKRMKQGDIKAFQILAAYRFGLPRDQVEESRGGGVLVLRMPELDPPDVDPIPALPEEIARAEYDTENELPNRAGKFPNDSALPADY